MEFWCYFVKVGLMDFRILYIQIGTLNCRLTILLCALFAAVSRWLLIVTKYSIVVGAEGVIKIYCSYKIVFRRFSAATGM